VCFLVLILQPRRVGMLCRFDRVFDVIGRAMPQFPHFRIVFFVVDIGVGFLQSLDRAQQAAAVFMHVDHGMVVQILAVVDGGVFNFTDRCLDLLDGNVLVGINPWVTGLVTQKPASGA